MNKELIDKLIDDYVNGRLSAEEKTQLDELLLESSDLKQEIIMRKDVSKGVEYFNNQELKTLLNKIHHEEIESSNPKNNYLKIGLITLGLLLLSFFSYQYFSSNATAVKEAPTLFAAYYAPYNPSVQTRGEENQNILSAFYANYLDENYSSAFKAIEGHLDNQQNETNLAAAICAIELQKKDIAISLLDKIIVSKDPYFADHAIWYKALLFIKDADNSTAKNLLQGLISNPNADHFKEAKELISKL